ncbi:MAG: recombination-associated protein RdgC [Desulfobacteraceae bacterium]|nr:recombination-associated protein RdgC [Desulfobacteraceae bacterium]
MAGMLSNTASLVRYAVEGELPADFWEFAADRIRHHSFRDIDDTFEERSVGWVSVMNMFDTQFAYASYAAGDYIMLSLRVDERKVAPALLKKFCMKEEERLKKEKELPRLSKRHRMEIKENIYLMLLKKALPGTAVYDLAWNLAEGTVLFFSTNKKAQETLEEFFKETFNLHLIQQIPYLTAGHLLDAKEQEALAQLNPEIFI